MNQFLSQTMAASSQNFEEAAKILSGSQKIIILAGAGMSADSGIPVYWTGDNNKYGSGKTFQGHTHLEHAFLDLWFKEPMHQAQYFNESWKEMLETPFSSPDSPYTTLIKWLNQENKDYFVITTNVDSGFMLTGFEETKIYEVHGAYRNSQCLTNDHGIFETKNPYEGYTYCPACRLIARPNVLFFNDPHFDYRNAKKAHKKLAKFTKNIDDGQPDGYSVLEIGVGTKVDILRKMTTEMNTSFKVPTVRVNAFQTGLDDSPANLKEVLTKPHVEITGKASSVLPAILSSKTIVQV